MSDFDKVRRAFEGAIEAHGVNAKFELRTGEKITIRMAESWRSEEALTAGMDQAQHRCRFMARSWDQLVSRPPEKGDQVVLNGQRRYSVLRAHPVVWDGQVLAYVARLSG